METGEKTVMKLDWERRVPDSRLPAPDAADIMRHFRENYPILLDGAQSQGADQRFLVKQARESLARGGVNLPPAAILREILDGVRSTPRPSTKAGLTAIGPKSARVWWDTALLEQPGDVLVGLDRPRPVLRFYDITGLDAAADRWHETFDIDVELDERGRTVQFWRADRSYVVDLGYVHADGRFARLARTNPADLPRDSRGPETSGQTVRSNLRPRAARDVATIVPDAAAREWADARPDGPRRDLEAELTLHMLYRAFLREGPRALRRAPRLLMRDEDVLRREYAKRQRERQRRKTSAPLRKKAAPAFLVAILDPVRAAGASQVVYYPAAPAAKPAALPAADVAEYAWFGQLIALCRSGRRPYAEARSAAPDLVRPLADSADFEVARLASPVFEAARSLRERLSGIAPVEVEAEADEAVEKKKSARLRDFGGIESRRMAKAGVRVTRMALTLEGRMRPGARLKVAGKLVYADADGNFRLECVLTGRRASIPLRAGLSSGGEASSVINVDWEKRAARDRKALALK